MKCTSRGQTGSEYWRWTLAGSSVPAAFLMGVCSLCWAQEVDDRLGAWRITPRISVGTTYSDNIGLTSASEAEEDIVLQVDPGISVRKQGGRLDLRLDYTAQGLLYANNGDANTINNQLQAFGTAELYESHLFLDAYGSISQVPVDAGGRTDVGNLGSDGGAASSLALFNNIDFGLPGAAGLFDPIGIFSNIALTDNQATGHRFGISPYWRQNVGGWAEALLRYRYDEVFYDEDGAVDQQSGQQVSDSDSRTHAIEFRLANGRQFSMLNWNLSYFYQEQDSQVDDGTVANADDHRESVTGQVSYRLNRYWALLAEAGYEDNQVTDFDSNNGTYWGLGAIWTPNRFVELRGFYGPDVNEIALRWNPSVRTNLAVSRRDQTVGVDPGIRWQGSFNHRTPHATWSVTYTDEVTNEQQLLGSELLGVGPEGQPLFLDEQGQVVVGSEGTFGLSDQNFRRKRLDAAMTYRRGPSSFLFNTFNEDRDSQDSAVDESVRGAGVLWTWRFAPRTASFLGTGWEQDELGEDQQNDYWVSVIGLARVFTPDSGGLISYRYYRNDADPAEQGFRENRLNIRFSMRF